MEEDVEGKGEEVEAEEEEEGEEEREEETGLSVPAAGRAEEEEGEEERSDVVMDAEVWSSFPSISCTYQKRKTAKC